MPIQIFGGLRAITSVWKLTVFLTLDVSCISGFPFFEYTLSYLAPLVTCEWHRWGHFACRSCAATLWVQKEKRRYCSCWPASAPACVCSCSGPQQPPCCWMSVLHLFSDLVLLQKTCRKNCLRDLDSAETHLLYYCWISFSSSLPSPSPSSQCSVTMGSYTCAMQNMRFKNKTKTQEAWTEIAPLKQQHEVWPWSSLEAFLGTAL